MIADLPKRPRVAAFHRALSIDEMRFLGTQTTLVGVDLENSPVGDDAVREICALPRLVNLTLSGTKITDAALEHLAKLPKLIYLFADRTRITGNGLSHFKGHPKLEVLWLCETEVTDKTIALALDIPKLTTLRIANTKITLAGMRALAASKRLQVVADDQFTPAQLAEIDKAQRGPAGAVAAADANAAKTVLLAFFEAISAWEKQMTASDGADTTAKRCAAIFASYGTPNAQKRHGGSRHWTEPPEYRGETFVDVEQPTKSKVIFYTTDRSHTPHRYTVTRSAGEWRVDRREAKRGEWKRVAL